MILFTDQLQRGNSNYPIVDSNDVKGGLWTVNTYSELETLVQTTSPKLKTGMLVYVTELDKYYQWKNNTWEQAKLGQGGFSGIPILTQEMYGELEEKPASYVSIDDMSNGVITNNTYTTSINGTYIDILFSAIRSLQSEVAKLKNTFNYGIQSYNNADTASSSIILNE